MVNNLMEWLITEGQVPYAAALAFMEKRAGEIRSGDAEEAVWLLEHPPLYTAGTSADPSDLLDPERFPVHKAGRGGQYTYHGPGQRIAYAMIDLKGRGNDVRAYVHDLEEWIIRTLERIGVTGERREGRIGIWVTRPGGREDKVAALGVRVRRWVTFHGIAINVNPDLEHFDGIVPCGVEQHGVTSLADLGLNTTMAEIDEHLLVTFAEVFDVPLPVPQGFEIL
ncbi:MAG: lipoyl(octanoyl) transferase LipB [Rhodospirillaceae bacterium]|nr:lipoyl(octanoyl) transferase LipB [Rhodospirillaceae bacterium]